MLLIVRRDLFTPRPVHLDVFEQALDRFADQGLVLAEIPQGR
jgi:hypothetical protein